MYVGLPTWFSKNHNNDYGIPILVAFILAFAFTIINLSAVKVCLATIAGIMVASIIKKIIDLNIDPTSHNLLPFEVITDIIVISFITVTGSGLAKLFLTIRLAIKKYQEKKS